MQIQIKQIDYDLLTDIDRAQVILLLSDRKFVDFILESRKKLNIPQEGFVNELDNPYGLGIPEKDFVFPLSNSGEVDVSGLKLRQKKMDVLDKNVKKEIENIIKHYSLDIKWEDTLKSVIFYNRFTPPHKYKFYYDGRLNKFIIALNQLTTANDLCEWIRENWEFNSMVFNADLYYTHTKINNLPRHENLEEQLNIIKYRDCDGMQFNDIAKKLLQSRGLENDDSLLVSEIKRIENTYYNLKKVIKSVQKYNLTKPRQQLFNPNNL